MSMKKRDFDKLFEKAFYGSGGGIFQEYYEKALNDNQTLDKILDDLNFDIVSQKENDNIKLTEDELKIELLKLKTKTLKEKLFFFRKYMKAEDLTDDDNDQCCYPELCGSIVGVLVKNKKFEDALNFIGLNDPRAQYLCWDS